MHWWKRRLISLKIGGGAKRLAFAPFEGYQRRISAQMSSGAGSSWTIDERERRPALPIDCVSLYIRNDLLTFFQGIERRRRRGVGGNGSVVVRWKDQQRRNVLDHCHGRFRLSARRDRRGSTMSRTSCMSVKRFR